jgi:methylated-DNA-protein-cysteine methyltransferase-like protein
LFGQERFAVATRKTAKARPRKTAKPAADSFSRLRNVVMKIPRGRVMTYGDLAAAAGMPGAARAAGRAMGAMGPGVPWQRVLGRKDARRAHITNERGKLEQRRLLEKEGVTFDAGGGVRLADFGWMPGRAKLFESRTRAG